MGASKTESFSKNHNKLAAQTKALSHPARIAIIEYLLSVDACICGDIVDHLPLAQPTVSQHLTVLKNAGLIKGSIEGTAICYCIDEKGFQPLQRFFDKVLGGTKPKNCC